MREAIRLAIEADHLGNLPVGAVIVLDGQIVGKGKNSIWKPNLDLTHHAEIEALRSVPCDLFGRSREMTLFTTLEPCVMCTGAILLYRIGRLVYGSSDPYGGVGISFGSLPPFFEERCDSTIWEGPVLPGECDLLYKRLKELEGLS